MEYANVAALYHTINGAVRQCCGRKLLDSHTFHVMEMWACLVGLTGTDFTRCLPNVGTKFIWECIADQNIWPALVTAFDSETRYENCF
jgi:hypothetical protein